MLVYPFWLLEAAATAARDVDEGGPMAPAEEEDGVDVDIAAS